MKATLKNGLLAAATAGLMAVGAGSANAGLLVNGWTFDFTAASLAGEGLTDSAAHGANPAQHVIEGIDEINFLALVHAETNDTNGNSLPTPGETFSTSGIGSATQFTSGGSNISPTAYGTSGQAGIFNGAAFDSVDGFEVTFKFKANGVYTSFDGQDANFVHTACADCVLELYVDNLNSGGTPDTGADLAAGTGVDDGTKFAEFKLLPGDGGVFDASVLDGSDDTTWQLTFALAGVILDTDSGIDLAGLVDANGDPITIALVDSNFDNTPNNPALSACNPTIGGPAPGAETPVDLCVREDGSFVLQVPEPATLGLMGTGLVALGAFYRRRRAA